jgi:ribonuclease G
VNSGSFTGRGKGAKLEDTITRTNLEAAEEVVSQLRLRDIGGIIVIDFIDMARARNRDTVLKTLRKSLDEDRTKTYVVEISPLGLVEMTRQNVTDGVREILTKTCPTCEGEGVILSEETVALETERRLRDLVKEQPEPEAYLVRVHPRVSARLLGAEAGRPLLELEREVDKHFHFEGSEGLPLDWFELIDTGSRDEIEQRALPFREGEELLVKIEEPHMYDEDAAVGKIDSYVISVAGAGRLIGEERLVRITEVGRSSAAAEIVGGAPPAEEGEDGNRSQRRRGRRGGRGRRRASASS